MHIYQNLFYIFLLAMVPYKAYTKEFTLKNLVEYALIHSPQSKNATDRLRISHFKVKNSIAQFLPSLDLTTDFGYIRNGNVLQDTPTAASLTLSLSETLYNNGANITSYYIAKQENSKSFIEYTRDQNQICLDLFIEYSNYSLLTYLLNVQKFQHQLISQHFESIKQEYINGGRKRVDFLQFKSQFQQSQLSISQAETNINQSIEQIKSIIGFIGTELKILPMQMTEINDLPINAKEDILKNHYEYKIANYDKNINKARIQLEKRKYWPVISLDANMSYTNPNYLSDHNQIDSINLSAFITLKYNLWDWGIRKRNLAIARAEAYIQNNNIDNYLLRLKAQIEKLFLDIKQHTESLRSNKELIDLEKQTYDSISRDYHNGIRTFLDFINAFNNYKTAQESYYTSFFNLKKSLSEYKYHRGKLYESIMDY